MHLLRSAVLLPFRGAFQCAKIVVTGGLLKLPVAGLEVVAGVCDYFLY